MKKYLYLIVLCAISQICNSQIKNDYDIYLFLNSEAHEMDVVEKKISDTVEVKTFSFSKDISIDNFKYILSVGKNGKIVKGVKPSQTDKKDGKITLYYYSYMHNNETLSDISNYNIINYDDFIDSEFKSFNQILQKANKIFIVDIKEKKNDLVSYEAFEVDF